jgi:hypothetical protein
MEPLDELDPLADVFPDGGTTLQEPAAESRRGEARDRGMLGQAFPLDPLLAPVFRAFEQAGVRSCLLRLPETPDDQVAALVERPAFGEARRILKANGFAPIPTWGAGPHARFVGYDPSADRWVTLDLVMRLNYGPYSELETKAEGGCLERRRWEGGVFVLAPDDAFWTLLLHVLLDGPASRGSGPRSIGKLERMAVEARADGPLARLVGTFLPSTWTPERMVDCAWDRSWAELQALAPVLAAEWARRQPRAARRRVLVNALERRISEKRLLPAPRGLSVALLAADAETKAELANELGRTFYLPVTYIRMGAPPRRRPGTRPLSRAGFFRTLLTQWRRYLLGWRRRGRGRLVVFDRYTYDYRVPPVTPPSAMGRLQRLVLGRVCPAPDLVVAVDAREPQDGSGLESVAYETIRRRYLALAQRMPDVIQVEADIGQERLRREITARIWHAYAAAPPTAWLLRLRELAGRS